MRQLFYFNTPKLATGYNIELVTKGLHEQKCVFPLYIGITILNFIFNVILVNKEDMCQVAMILWDMATILVRILVFCFSRRFQNINNTWLFDLLWICTSNSSTIGHTYFLDEKMGIDNTLLFTASAIPCLVFCLSFIVRFPGKIIWALTVIPLFLTNKSIVSVANWAFYVSVCTTTVIIVTLIVMKEISNRQIFLEKFLTQEKQDTFVKILNEVPENIIVINKDLKEKYINKCCRKAFSEKPEENLDLQEIFKNFNEITFRNLNTLTTPTTQGDCCVKAIVGHEDAIKPNIQATSTIPQQKTLLHIFNKTEEHGEFNTCDYLRQMRNEPESETLIADCKFYNPRDAKNPCSAKSIELKMTMTSFGAEECIILIFKDTTQRDIIARLSDNNKYKDNLLASVSHELRTPLNGNLNFIEIALSDPNVPNHVKEELLIPAQRSGKLLLHLINDLLDYSQSASNHLKMNYSEIDLEKCCRETLELARMQAAKKNIQLILDYDHVAIPKSVMTDWNRLSQVILNLVINAVKFTFQGSITLKVQNHQQNIKISVIDTGIGIKKEDQETLFKAFRVSDMGRESLNPKGVGLGLSIANLLAKELGPHSGNESGISIMSKEGEGSIFSFLISDKSTPSLPHSGRLSRKTTIDSWGDDIAEENLNTELSSKLFHHRSNSVTQFSAKKTSLNSPSPVSTAKSIQESPSPSPKCQCTSILAVDDDVFNIMAIEQLLKATGNKCDIAYNGKEAYEKICLRESHPCGVNCSQYKIIFMDGSMPVMDGIQATKLLRSEIKEGKLQEMAIVGCTAVGTTEFGKACLASGMDEVILKPLNWKKLNQALSKYFNKEVIV